MSFTTLVCIHCSVIAGTVASTISTIRSVAMKAFHSFGLAFLFLLSYYCTIINRVEQCHLQKKRKIAFGHVEHYEIIWTIARNTLGLGRSLGAGMNLDKV